MPVAPLPACRHPRCPARAVPGRGLCSEHLRQSERTRRARANHSQLHGSRQWKAARAAFLARPENRFCCYCREEGKQTPAECVDHKHAAKGDAATFWREQDWIPSCVRHNTLKGLTEGGLGRPINDDPSIG